MNRRRPTHVRVRPGFLIRARRAQHASPDMRVLAATFCRSARMLTLLAWKAQP